MRHRMMMPRQNAGSLELRWYNCCLTHIRLANWRHNISENRCCTYIIDARSFNWIFLRLFIYVMVVSATVRYVTSVSHISLPQTSVSVDSWVVKEKSKNYHNWTSSASHDVCAAPIFTYIMSGCGLIYEKWMCVKSEGRDMRAELCALRTIPPCFVTLI